jgi:hypothetical protein
MRSSTASAMLALIFVSALDGYALAASCGDRANLNRQIQELNQQVQELNGRVQAIVAQAGGVDTPEASNLAKETCHLSNKLSSLYQEFAAIIDTSPSHCDLSDAMLQKIHAVNSDKARASCGVNWK